MSKYGLVKKFNQEIINLLPQALPESISTERVNWFRNTVIEELDEFKDAWINQSPVGMMDALIDMTYFILGRVYECGFTEEQWDKCFEAVHNCNMTKKKGNKGRGSDEDAVKDESWVGPEEKIAFILNNTSRWDVEQAPDCITDVEQDVESMPPLEAPISPIEPLTDIKQNVVHHKPSVYLEKDGEQRILSIEELELFSKMSPVFKEVAQIAIKKSQDYNNGNGTPASRAAYFPFGLLSYAQMLHTKSQRLNSLAQQDKEPNNESIRDTLLDLINYACFAVEAIDKGEI